MNCAVEILRKHKTTLEINIKGVPGMELNEKTLTNFKRQVKDIKKAIEYLEYVEMRRHSVLAK